MLDVVTIKLEAMVELGINPYEYMVAHSIHKLCHNHKSKNQGWCSASKQYLAECYGLNRVSVSRIIKKLVEEEILEKKSAKSTLIRTTEKWLNTVELRKAFQGSGVTESYTSEDHKCNNVLHAGVTESYTKCNNELHPSYNSRYKVNIDKPLFSDKIKERAKELQEEMSADQMTLELICMQNSMEIGQLKALIGPWSLENTTTIFQNTNHRRNSFKSFVRNSKMKVSHKTEAPTTGRPMLKAGERRRRVG